MDKPKKSYAREVAALVLLNCLAMAWAALIYRPEALAAVAGLIATPVATAMTAFIWRSHQNQTVKP